MKKKIGVKNARLSKFYKQNKKVFDFLINNAIYIILFLLVIGMVIKEPKFLSINNLVNILKQSSTRIIFALGVGTIIVAKGTDLSLGRQVGLAAVISASFMQSTSASYKMYPNLEPLWNVLFIGLHVLIGVIIAFLLSLVYKMTLKERCRDTFIGQKKWYIKLLRIVVYLGIAAGITLLLRTPIKGLWNLDPWLWKLIGTILITMLVTVIISGFNGFVVAKLKVDPFVATLGMMVIVYGLACIYVDREPHGAQPIGNHSVQFKNFAQGNIEFSISKLHIQIPHLIIFAIIITAIMWIVWNKTKFGKNIFAVGGNPEAAAVSGVNVVGVIIAVFVLAGALYGFGGTLEAARIGSTTNNTGNMYELDAISACIVGGLSFNGGIGSISGIITGVLIFQIIAYGLAFLSVNPYLSYIIKGAIIISAVAIDNRKNMKKK